MGKKAPSRPKVDWKAQGQALAAQFRQLDPKDPSLWPLAPKVLLCMGIALCTALIAWLMYLRNFEEDLEVARQKEVQLREDFQKKMVKAVSLDGLKKQREQVQLFVTQLEKQLPSKAEMAALLSDINQAGLGRSLQFELFRPGAVVAKDYYAELPIALRVSGNYHDMGAFAADIANLSRIVTLNNIQIAPVARTDKNTAAEGGSLVMDATIRTFRYLDAEELAARNASTKKKGS